MLGIGRRLGWWRTESQAEGLSSIEQIGASATSGIKIVFRGLTLQNGEFGEGRRGIWGILRLSVRGTQDIEMGSNLSALAMRQGGVGC